MSDIVSLSDPRLGSQKGSQKTEYVPLTDKSIKALKPTGKRRVVWAKGLEGLGIRISPKGTKSFVFKFGVDGRDRWKTYGKYPQKSLAEVLREYGADIDTLRDGGDPASEMVRKNAARRVVPTIKDAAGDYIEKHAKPNKRTWREDERQLKRDVIPALGPATRVNKITKHDIRSILDDIVARGSPVQANRTLALLKRFFNFIIDEYDDGLIEVSPCYRVKPRISETPRDRFLSLDEIRLFWNKIGHLEIEEKTSLASQFLLLTMQRQAEVLGIRKAEVNVRAGTWIIPAERSKNKKAHLVPLSPTAIQLIKRMGALAPEDEFLLPGRGDAQHLGHRPIQRAMASLYEACGMIKFTPHDLRRTGSTQLAAFRVPRFDRERILNHTDQGVGSVYDLYDYEDEKRAALNMWADIIARCASSKNPVNEKKIKSEIKYQDYYLS